jgi:dihydropteroate synthase
MTPTVARLRVPYFLMHMRGDPTNMQSDSNVTYASTGTSALTPSSHASAAALLSASASHPIADHHHIYIHPRAVEEEAEQHQKWEEQRYARERDARMRRRAAYTYPYHDNNNNNNNNNHPYPYHDHDHDHDHDHTYDHRKEDRRDRRTTTTNVVSGVARELSARIERTVGAGLHPMRLALDPGIGFAKTPAGNFALLHHLPRLRALLPYRTCSEAPMLVGPSRKGFLKWAGVPGRPEDRDVASAACMQYAMGRGADLFRVHHVRFAADTRAIARLWPKSKDPGV